MVKKESDISKLVWSDMSPEEKDNFIKKEKERQMQLSEISISLSDYNDIFSDFDPRPSSDRALSDDFLAELKRASLVKSNEVDIDLKLLVPVDVRDKQEESVIKRRLKEYFQRHFKITKKELHQTKMIGLILIIIGLALMFVSYLVYSGFFEVSEILENLILIISEPGGWFLFWIGGERIVYDVKSKKPEFDFYNKISRSKITFHSY